MALTLSLTVLLSILLPLLPFQAQAQQTRCQWATLRSATDLVIESLAAGTTPGVPTIFSAPSLLYTQNLNTIPIASPASLLSAPLEVLHTHSLVDQDACAGFIKLVVVANNSDSNSNSNSNTQEAAERDGETYLLAAQIHFNYTFNTGTTVRQMDLVFAGAGDWQMMPAAPATPTPTPTLAAAAAAAAFAAASGEGLNATALAALLEREDWGALSRAVQDSRDVLEGVAGGYLDFLESAGNGTLEGEQEVAWGRPCARLEAAVYTAVAEGESCVGGLMPRREGGIVERKFVVDESVGAVSVLAKDEGMGGAPSVFELRVVEGKLRYVHQFAATTAVDSEG